MTVVEKVVDWLVSNPKIEMVDIDLLNADEGMALIKAPADEFEPYLVGGKHTKYYTFSIRQNSQLSIERINNQRFLEELEAWIREQNKSRNLPFEDCISIKTNGGFELHEQDGEQTIYTFIIELTYMEG